MKQLTDRIGIVSLIGVMCIATLAAVCDAASRTPVSQRTTRTGRNTNPSASSAKFIEMAKAAEQKGDLLSADRLYRRSLKKGWISEQEANEKAAQTKERRLDFSFVQAQESVHRVAVPFVHPAE